MLNQIVTCSKMPKDSNYKSVTGRVTTLRNGYVVIAIESFVTIWDSTVHEGNGCQTTSALIENCVVQS